MAGFDFSAGRSNNMVAAEERGCITAGRWGKLHGVSAAAVVAVMKPAESHHTGTGRRGKSRLTPVLPGGLAATADQLAAMKSFDSGQRPQIAGCFLSWDKVYDGRYGRKRYVPLLAIFEGDEAASRKLKEFQALSADELALAKTFEGSDIRDFRSALANLRRGVVPV